MLETDDYLGLSAALEQEHGCLALTLARRPSR